MKTARFKGTCARCQKAINIGDQIKWARRGPESGRKVHENCESVPSWVPVPTPESKPEPKPDLQKWSPLDMAIRQFLLDGRKIEAIKYYREKTSSYLIDSKNYVDSVEARMHNEQEPNETEETEEQENEVKPKTTSELNHALEVLGKYIPTALNENDIRKIVETEFAKFQSRNLSRLRLPGRWRDR